ncbi:hypothetical protein NQ317_000796 [Molorchus minor]|uniref:Uncharacterized protein n=1 Tax=Molorchus minor TaxID=1323400 RepID=A0ABQ9ISB9_9CUCU|nr:hypothetical protein NQ317_000796 [Molorchus minor]
MGCVSSKSDINDRHPNIFQVTNVNDQGRPISPGKLQVTETELVLYQRGKNQQSGPYRTADQNFQPEGFVNPVTAPTNARPHAMISRPGSVSSNGPISPTTISSPPDVPLEHNNNKRVESSCHVYMNVDTKICTKDINVAKEMTDIPEKLIESEKHYARSKRSIANSPQVAVESPKVEKKSYATIDFPEKRMRFHSRSTQP